MLPHCTISPFCAISIKKALFFRSPVLKNSTPPQGLYLIFMAEPTTWSIRHQRGYKLMTTLHKACRVGLQSSTLPESQPICYIFRFAPRAHGQSAPLDTRPCATQWACTACAHLVTRGVFWVMAHKEGCFPLNHHWCLQAHAVLIPYGLSLVFNSLYV